MEANHKINKVGLRNLHMEDYDQLARSFKRIYADHDVFWTKEQIKKVETQVKEEQKKDEQVKETVKKDYVPID